LSSIHAGAHQSSPGSHSRFKSVISPNAPFMTETLALARRPVLRSSSGNSQETLIRPASLKVADHRCLPRPTPSARRPRSAGRRSASERHQAIIARARAAIPDLPTDALYRIHSLLEQALAGREIDSRALAELERALKQM
jgi:hypothetical protein